MTLTVGMEIGCRIGGASTILPKVPFIIFFRFGRTRRSVRISSMIGKLGVIHWMS